jgi:hypothetical protein
LENDEKTTLTVKISGIPELPTAKCSMSFSSTKTGYTYSNSTGG